jgi:hypothetical protein
MATTEKEEEEKIYFRVYRSISFLPALWNIKSKDYINRVKKMNNTNICFSNIYRV